MLGLSIFWYQATIFDMPKTVIFRINKILFPFVWGKKREWMARSSVSQPLAQGGLGVVDVSCKLASLRAVWIRRFFSHCSNPGTVFFNTFTHYFVLYWSFGFCSVKSYSKCLHAVETKFLLISLVLFQFYA